MTFSIPHELRQRLLAVRDNAYVPYSGHPVGAALESSDGQIFYGCNVEIANYKGLCAEASAIAALVSNGRQDISALYVIGPGDHLCTPCGDCRQRIREFASAATRIHVLDGRGEWLKSYSMDELLPDSFGPENLGRPSSMQP